MMRRATPSSRITTWQTVAARLCTTWSPTKKGEAQFKKQESDSPTVNSIRLVAYALKPRIDKITLDLVSATTANPDDLLLRKSKLDQFFIKAMDAQVARNNGGKANFYYLAERPRNNSTKTYKSEIIDGSVKLPQDAYGPNILSSIFEHVVVTIRLHPHVSASVLTILNAVAANNGNSNYVDIGASGATAITGDLPAPLSIQVAGGDATTTKRLLAAIAYNGTPSNFKNIYWAKDATLTNNTAALTGNYTVTNKQLTSNVATLTTSVNHKHAVGDVVTVTGVDATFNGTYTLSAVGSNTVSYPKVAANVGSTASGGTITGEIDGNGTGNGTRTTAANTNENKTHQWINSTNVGDQVHRLQGFVRLRSNTAGRYSVRFRVGLTDGTNNFFRQPMLQPMALSRTPSKPLAHTLAMIGHGFRLANSICRRLCRSAQRSMAS
jgi:hypothetical protein